MEARLAALTQAVDKIAAENSGEIAASFNTLKSAIDAGRPYADLLLPFAGRPEAAELAKSAATGVPGIDTLGQELANLREQNRAAATVEGPLGRITSLFGGAIKVRRTAEATGSDDPFAAARQALDAGDLDGAADRIARAAAGPDGLAWAAAARARAEVDKTLTALAAALGSPAPGLGN